MKNILIINLTRMGDLVQTTPVVRGLSALYPGVKISLFVNIYFAGICDYIPNVHRVFMMDFKEVKMKVLENDPVGAYRLVEGIIDQVNDTVYDLVINFSHTVTSAVLMSLISARECRGLSIDEGGRIIKRHPWIKYFFNIVPGRAFNPFHLCDTYIKAAGLEPDGKGLELAVPRKTQLWMDSVLDKEGVGRDDLVIGLQLGASAAKRMWPLAAFASLADRLAEAFGARIALIGSSKEVDLGREFETAAAVKPLNFIGKTEMKDLIALLKRCALVIGNDTGPLHMATAVGTRVIGIYLSTADVTETGPYGTDHYVVKADTSCSPCGFDVECCEMTCKRVISVENMYALTCSVLKDPKLPSIEDGPLWKDVQVYRSFFDHNNLMDYRPLIKRPLRREKLYSHIYRETWLRILDNRPFDGLDDLYGPLKEKLLSWYSGEKAEGFEPFFSEDGQALSRLKDIADEGELRVIIIEGEARREDGNIERIKELWSGIKALDDELDTLAGVYPHLLPLVIIYKYGKDGLESKELSDLALETAVHYRELLSHTSAIIRLREMLIEGLTAGGKPKGGTGKRKYAHAGRS